MKAYVLRDINQFLYEDTNKPELLQGTVLVKVKNAGICGSDIPRIYTAGTYSYPLIPGHEFAGIVVNVADDVDKLWINKRVGVFPLIPCEECEPCKKQQYEMCKNYNYLGSRTDGGFAEYVRVPVWNLIELPEQVTFEQAAMLEPMAVAIHAIRKADVNSNDSIAICGLGTIGMLIIMFLKEMGCDNILCIGNKDFQKKTLKHFELSEDNYCDSNLNDVEEWIMNKTSNRGVDIFFDCVGKNDVILQAINCVSPGGKIQLVGNPVSDMELPKNIFWKILRKQLSVYGTWNSSFTHDIEDDWHYVLDKLKDGKVHPEKLITHRYSLENLMGGFEVMRDKKEDYIKVMGEIL